MQFESEARLNTLPRYQVMHYKTKLVLFSSLCPDALFRSERSAKCPSACPCPKPITHIRVESNCCRYFDYDGWAYSSASQKSGNDLGKEYHKKRL